LATAASQLLLRRNMRLQNCDKQRQLLASISNSVSPPLLSALGADEQGDFHA
jgi:hypothetical protein